jgi:two-component system response regulator AlgR
VYIKAELKMLTVHTTAGCHVLEGSLVDLEQRYPEHVLRIHRSCLVNPAFLQRLEFAEPGGWYLRLHGIAQPLPVSRRQVAAVRKTLTICKK